MNERNLRKKKQTAILILQGFTIITSTVDTGVKYWVFGGDDLWIMLIPEGR